MKLARFAFLAIVMAVAVAVKSPKAYTEGHLYVRNATPAASGVELIADPQFLAGFLVLPACRDPNGDASCGHAPKYLLKSPYFPHMADVKPVWEIAQWGSQSNLGDGRSFDDGYGWATADKRLVVYRDGMVEMAVNGDSELNGRYRTSEIHLPSLLLSQTVAAPGMFARQVPSVDRMGELLFNLEIRLTFEDQNRKEGYDPNKHALIFPVNFTIQNLNRSNPGYGEYVWLQISAYDDRFRAPSNRTETQIDLGTRRLIYFVPSAALGGSAKHGEWLVLHGDILPFAKRAIAIAYDNGLLSSGQLSDYTVGALNIGYELTGLNIAIFQFRNFSLQMK